ncbi:glutathione peroxidase [Mycena rebaudengoi]|nr:glutathione peroxidase [Mycena rebaudengoi]
MSTFYTLKATKKNDDVFDFADLKGKTVLIVNTASACGFTPQYTGLQALYEKYKEKDFLIIGFPCNQVSISHTARPILITKNRLVSLVRKNPVMMRPIATFCVVNHGVTFPLMKKSDVNGDKTNEVFKWLKAQKSGLLGLARVKWNFEKFLVNKEGVVVQRWASTTTPEAIDAEVAKIL